MLRFFRNIRRKLLDRGSLRKYLVYAAGEVLLVMIGILLALQVNNWNERKKLTQSEAVYMTRLKEDVSSMMEYYGKPEYISEEINEAHDALDFLESCGEKKELEASFRQTLTTHQILRNFPQKRSTYHEMVSSGAFARMGNVELKDAIANMFNQLEMANLSIDYFRNELGRASAVVNNFVSFTYDSDRNLTVSCQVGDLCRNDQFQNAVVEVIDAREDWLFIYQNIFRSIQDANALLETE